MTQYFGKNCLLTTITHEQALDYRIWMLNKREPKTLSPSTVGREMGMARQFFKTAIKLGYVDSNPFEGISAVVRGNPERMHMITHEDGLRLINACPDNQWKLLIALARFAGLRIASEVRHMVWSDFDIPKRQVLIRSSKTEHNAGGDRRTIPIFDEVLPHLLAWADNSPTSGPVFDLPMTNSAALRKPFMAIIERTGLQVWPNLWKNLRSSCITDAEKRFRKYQINAWFGNTEQVRLEHYTQITDEDFLIAASAYSVQQGTETDCMNENTPALTVPESAFVGTGVQPSGRYWT